MGYTQYIKKEVPVHLDKNLTLEKKAATYSPTLHCSTIGDVGLNFSVRNGKRWNPDAITTILYLNGNRKHFPATYNMTVNTSNRLP